MSSCDAHMNAAEHLRTQAHILSVLPPLPVSLLVVLYDPWL